MLYTNSQKLTHCDINSREDSYHKIAGNSLPVSKPARESPLFDQCRPKEASSIDQCPR